MNLYIRLNVLLVLASYVYISPSIGFV